MEGTSWSGEVLSGRFQVEERIATGGMSEVYRGVDRDSGQPVAIKVPYAVFGADPAFAERLLREAETVAGLTHPNIVRLHASGRHNGHPYLVMELVDGESLATILRRDGPLAPAQALTLARGVLAALAHAHSRGVIHRDVKPGNVLVGAGGEVKLVDFGIAHAQAESAATLTGTGELLGSVRYLAPERLSGQPATAASDLYSLGVMLYEMLVGRPPFGGDLPAVAAQHLGNDPTPPSRLRAGLSPALDGVVLRALAKKPEARYPSAAAMLAEIDHLGSALHDDATARLAVPVAAAVAGAPGQGPSPVTRDRQTARGWAGARLRALALAGGMFAAAAALVFALATAQPESVDSESGTPIPLADQITPTPAPTAVTSPTPTAAPVAPVSAPAARPTADDDDAVDDGSQGQVKRAEQAQEQAEKRLEQLQKKQEKKPKRGRN